MLFNSIEFIIFFIVVTTIFFMIPIKGRVVWLLLASSFFYIWFKPAYLLIIIAIICIDYTLGIYMATGRHRRTALIVSLIANIGILAVFKYYNFIFNNITSLGNILGINVSFPALTWILPIGLSFHTFQAMSYTIEVYKRNYPAERNFKRYALYVMFYPQLVAGPIERPQHLLPQLKLDKPFSHVNAVAGLQRIIWGLFKKMVVADGAAIIADAVFNNIHTYTGISLWLGVACFTIQIYGDFSGYSDIAIGCAQIMGVELSENFNAPYLAKSPSDFWRRWHISLSSWFRDYVYRPLGGSRVNILKWVFNILVVFALSGLWHGANWTFVVWGLMHAFALIIERVTKHTTLYKYIFNKYPALINNTGMIITLTYVSWAWVLFRVKHISEACYVYGNAFYPVRNLFSVHNLTYSLHALNFKTREIGFTLVWIAIMLVVYYVKQNATLKLRWLTLPTMVRWGAYYVLVVIILLFGIYEHREFIYFQF